MNTNQHKLKRQRCRAGAPLAAVHSGATVSVAVVDEVVTRTAASETQSPPKKSVVIRWVTAPQSSLPGVPAVQGVALNPGEDVQWHWTHAPTGSDVSGYNIVPRFASIRVHLRLRKHG